MGVMKLKEYLLKHQITYEAFGKKVGVSDISVWRWVDGQRFPARKLLPKIAQVTKGEVTANDFVKAA